MHALLLYRHVIRQSPTVPAPPSRLCTHTLADNADTSNCACTTIPFVYPHTRRHMQTHPTVPAPPSRLCTHTLADTCRHIQLCLHHHPVCAPTHSQTHADTRLIVFTYLCVCLLCCSHFLKVASSPAVPQQARRVDLVSIVGWSLLGVQKATHHEGQGAWFCLTVETRSLGRRAACWATCASRLTAGEGIGSDQARRH